MTVPESVGPCSVLCRNSVTRFSPVYQRLTSPCFDFRRLQPTIVPEFDRLIAANSLNLLSKCKWHGACDDVHCTTGAFAFALCTMPIHHAIWRRHGYTIDQCARLRRLRPCRVFFRDITIRPGGRRLRSIQPSNTACRIGDRNDREPLSLSENWNTRSISEALIAVRPAARSD